MRYAGGPQRILLVDDSQSYLDRMTAILREAGYEVVWINSPFALSSALSELQPDLVVVDVDMPGLPGDKLVEITMRNRRGGLGCPIVLHSDHPDAELEALVASSGAAGHVRKTSDLMDIVRGVERFIGPPRR